MRRAQRRRNLVTTAIAIVVAAGVVWSLSSTGANDGNGNVAPVNPDMTAEEAGCGDVESAEPQEAEHIAEGAEHEPYNTNPPTSGPHYGSPLAPIGTGFYSEPVEAEKVIHNLEHGQIVIYYNPDAPEDTVDDIVTLTKQEPEATVAVPYDDIEAPSQLVLAAWANLQECVQVAQEVVDEFRADFQGRGPEQVGIPTFEG